MKEIEIRIFVSGSEIPFIIYGNMDTFDNIVKKMQDKEESILLQAKEESGLAVRASAICAVLYNKL